MRKIIPWVGGRSVSVGHYSSPPLEAAKWRPQTHHLQIRETPPKSKCHGNSTKCLSGQPIKHRFVCSVLYGLVVWGGCPNAELLHSLEVLHRRAARIIYNLPQDMPTEEVYRHSNWNTLTLYYKLRLIKLLHSVFIGEAPTALSYLTNKPCTAYNFRRSNNIIVPRFNSQFLKNSISYRGAILWNAVSSHFTDQFTVFYRKVKKDSYFKELDFSAQSVQSLPRHYQDFKCF